MIKKLGFYIKVLVLYFILFILQQPEFIQAACDITMRDSVIEFQFIDKKASTNTRFRTIGWMIHSQRHEGRAPMTLGSNKSAAILGFREVDSIPLGNGEVLTKFEIPKSDLEPALKGTDMAAFKNGQTLYLSSIY